MKFASWLQHTLMAYGIWGVLGLAFIDSGLIPLPEAIDVLVVTFAAKYPHRVWEFVVAATIGSLAGCLFLYFIAAKGGHAFLERRVGKERAEQLRARFEKYEFITLVVAAILPPPMPFKAFVLVAGVVEVRLRDFILAIVLGRGFRYLAEAYLAVKYGNKVWKWMLDNGPWFASGILMIVIAVGAVMWLRSQRVRNA